MKVQETIQKAWRRFGGSRPSETIEATADATEPRKTLGLPSILTPYLGASPANLMPKPTPANLRRFAETPLARRAINVIKDRIASLDWQIKLKRVYATESVTDAAVRGDILRRCLEEPNCCDSFRTLLEQVLEDTLVGGFGAIEMVLTGDGAAAV